MPPVPICSDHLMCKPCLINDTLKTLWCYALLTKKTKKKLQPLLHFRGATQVFLDPNIQHLMTLLLPSIAPSRFPHRTCATSHWQPLWSHQQWNVSTHHDRCLCYSYKMHADTHNTCAIVPTCTGGGGNKKKNNSVHLCTCKCTILAHTLKVTSIILHTIPRHKHTIKISALHCRDFSTEPNHINKTPNNKDRGPSMVSGNSPEEDPHKSKCAAASACVCEAAGSCNSDHLHDINVLVLVFIWAMTEEKCDQWHQGIVDYWSNISMDDKCTVCLYRL